MSALNDFTTQSHATARMGAYEADILCLFTKPYLNGHWRFTEGFIQAARCRDHGTPIPLGIIPVEAQNDLIRLASGIAGNKIGAV